MEKILKAHGFVAGLLVALLVVIVALFLTAITSEAQASSHGIGQYDEEPECPVGTHVQVYEEIIEEEHDVWYAWTGGHSNDHPFPDERWQLTNGEHNGFPQDVWGLYQRDKGNSGNSDFFWHELVEQVVDRTYDCVPDETEEPTPTDDPTCEVNLDCPTMEPNPTDNPTPQEPKPAEELPDPYCVGTALVTEDFDGESYVKSYDEGNPKCSDREVPHSIGSPKRLASAPDVEVIEEGM